MGTSIHLDSATGETVTMCLLTASDCLRQPRPVRDVEHPAAADEIGAAEQDYGGDQGIKGNITSINSMPFAAPPLAPAPQGYDPKTQAVGVGYTPEGLDQNPVRAVTRPTTLCSAYRHRQTT
eukprot:COSAG01_NODE_338_length_18671_cov_259.238154_6_plen_122_part_00